MSDRIRSKVMGGAVVGCLGVVAVPAVMVLLVAILFIPALAVGALTAGVILSPDAASYDRAPACSGWPQYVGVVQPTAECYLLAEGEILSVNASYGRLGETDAVRLRAGSQEVRTTLYPSSEQSSSVRTGAAITTKIFDGQITEVSVDGTAVPTGQNPSHARFQALLVGGVFGGACLVLMIAVVFQSWRRRHKVAVIVGGSGGGQPMPVMRLEALGRSVPGALGYVVRPRLALLQLTLLLAFTLGVLALSRLALANPTVSQWVVPTDVAALILEVTAVLAYRTNRSIFVDSDFIGSVSIIGSVRRWPKRDIQRIVRLALNGRYGPMKYLVFVDQTGGAVMRVGGSWWNPDELEAFATATGKPVEGSWEMTTGWLRMARTYPGSVNVLTEMVLPIAVAIAAVVLVIQILPPTSR
jgi:hypothetical protein